MKNVNLFKSNLQGKQLISEKSESKKAVKNALVKFGPALDSALTAVIRDTDIRARNVANAAKGSYKTAIAVVEACYPYQTEAGVLCAKHTDKETGARVWRERNLTAASARAIMRESLNNFIKFVGKPEITRVQIGAPVEAKPAKSAK